MKSNLISNKSKFSLLFIFLLVSAFASLCIGRYSLNLGDVLINLRYFLESIEPTNKSDYAVVILVRLPRVCFAILVGASLAASGATYQGLFKNPLVSPDILGVSSGAAVGASIAIILGFHTAFMAFIFGLFAVFLVVFISCIVSKNGSNLLILVLIGIVISSLFSAITALIKYLADSQDDLPEITFWLMGSLARTGGYESLKFMLIISLFCLSALFLLRHKINILSFSHEEAKSMGLNVKLYTFLIIIISTLLCASCVAFCGIVGWIGLVVPHMVRFLVGANFSALLPASMLVGAIFLLIIDTLSRSLVGSEIPLSILTSLIGAPIFVYLLYRSKAFR